MHIKKYFGLFGLSVALAGCSGTQNEWFSEYGTQETGTPNQMQYGTFDHMIGATTPGALDMPHRIAVLLPLSGNNAPAGDTIRTSIETAVLQRAPQNLTVAFYDTANPQDNAINRALASNPDIIIGPLFAANARTLRDAKPYSLPVLSFTSDATAVGNGVLSMSLMPTNSVEAIIKEMTTDGVKNFIVVAPNTQSGKLMAGTARAAATIYDIPVTGVFYYNEKNTDSIKDTTITASMNNARTAANNRAREVLSDILTKETLTSIERSSLNMQLDNLSKTDTLGKLPYDAVLFLGSGEDTRSLASFMRYYGVNSHDVRFYGTAFWDGADIASDITMSGAKFASLAPISDRFSTLYEYVDGHAPTRLSTFGYDAANIAMGMIYSNKSHAAYLLNPSGYMGAGGLFRLKPTGESERALRIMELNGSGTPHMVRAEPANFITPIYNIEQRHISPARAMDLETPGINPMHYIKIPDRLRSKYKSKTYGATTKPATSNAAQIQESVVILPEDDRVIISNPEFTPVKPETIGRTYIDEIEIEE